LIHFNACEHYRKPYHYRSQKHTLGVKKTVFHNERSMATMRRDDRRLRDEGLITKHRRRGRRNIYGEPWISSITRVTWGGIKHLVDRHLKPRSLYKVWKEVCGIVVKKGPPELRDEPDLKRPLNGVPARASGRWPFPRPP